MIRGKPLPSEPPKPKPPGMEDSHELTPTSNSRREFMESACPPDPSNPRPATFCLKWPASLFPRVAQKSRLIFLIISVSLWPSWLFSQQAQQPQIPTSQPSPALVTEAPQSEEKEAEPGLRHIGYETFAVDVTKIQPGPLDRYYLISPGDKLVLRIWGQLQLTYLLTVSNDSYVEIPEVPGRLYVSGLTLSQLEQRVRQHLAKGCCKTPDFGKPASSRGGGGPLMGAVEMVYPFDRLRLHQLSTSPRPSSDSR